MSALGHKQTLEQASEMSALPSKADMRLAVQKCQLTPPSSSCTSNGDATLHRNVHSRVPFRFVIAALCKAIEFL